MLVFSGLCLVIAVSISACATGKKELGKISSVGKIERVSLQTSGKKLNGEESLLLVPSGGRSRALPPNFRIGPEDVLEILVWKNDVLSRTVTVRPDGRISLPLLGDVLVAGLKPNQVREEVSTLLKEYMENPVVTVIVQQINSYVIYLMGEVANPGKYQLKSNITLLQSLALAGGFTQFASKNKIMVFRREYGRTSDTKIRVRYDEIIAGSHNEDILLKPGDTILVP